MIPDQPTPEDSGAASDASTPKKKLKVRTHTPRADDLTQEVLEFIAAIDDYKRKNMRSFLENKEILNVFHQLGYTRRGAEEDSIDAALEEFAQVRDRYREQEGRLFPTWSEVFQLLSELGYSRAA